MRSLTRRPASLPVLLAPLALVLAVLVAPVTPPVGASLAPGEKVVRFAGVSVQVPSAWPVYDLSRDPRRCVRLDVHAVYLGSPGPDEQCPAHLVGRTEAVVIASDRGGSVSSPPSVAGEMSRVVGRSHLRVTAAFGSRPDVARAVMQSATADTASPAPTASPAAFTTAAAPRAATATPGVFIGNGFDTCAAPSESAMQTWMTSSPYRAANIYIGGAERACADGNLSATWVSHVRAMGWRLIPTYVGIQAPCNSGTYSQVISTDPATASTQGQQSADDAIARAQSFGITAGSPIYFDMESYSRSASGCSAAVLAFLSGWTNELHAQGWASGAYGSGASLVTDLSAQWGSAYTEPDDLWFANWNNLDSEYGDPYVPDSQWAGHRRIHQWHGGANETYGGVTLNIDGDAVDGQIVGPAGGDCVAYPAEDYGPDGCDGALSLTGPLQFWRFGSPYGEQQSMRWTFGNGSTESDGATWAPAQLTAGVYDLSAWIPAQHSGATAHYTVNDFNGSHSVSVNQTSARGTWAALGEFTTGVTGTITAHVGDDTSTSSVVAVDAMKFHFVHAIDQQPPNGTITAPATGSFARPGAAVTLAGWFTDDVYVTKVVFSVADTSGAWQVVGTDTHNGNGTFKTTWKESYPEGTVVSVRAEIHDTVDHVTTATASNVLTIDATRPTASMVQPGSWTTTARSQRLTWSGADNMSGVASYDLRGKWSTYTGWTSSWHWIGPAGGFTSTAATYGGMRPGWQYCFEVRAHDRAGNLSAWSGPRCMGRALDDAALRAAAGPWSRSRSSRFYASTYSSSSTLNAKLTLSTVAASRIGLLATVCSTCGVVRAYIGGRYVATISLRSARWHSHVFVLSRAFPARTGTLTLRVVTSRKLVRIDGIVLARL